MSVTLDVAARVAAAIRDVPDFPRPGINFKDITPVLLDAGLFRDATEAMAAPFAGDRISHVVAIESRGFILGAPVAQSLGAAFVPFRKPGKLPHIVERIEYELEYGVDALECHRDALGGGQRVLIVDDVLATGGTAAAAVQLVRKLGGELHGLSFLIELLFLNGRDKIPGENTRSVLQY